MTLLNQEGIQSITPDITKGVGSEQNPFQLAPAITIEEAFEDLAKLTIYADNPKREVIFKFNETTFSLNSNLDFACVGEDKKHLFETYNEALQKLEQQKHLREQIRPTTKKENAAFLKDLENIKKGTARRALEKLTSLFKPHGPPKKGI